MKAARQAGGGPAREPLPWHRAWRDHRGLPRPQLDCRHREAKCLLFARIETKLGKVVTLRVDAVAELLLACKRLDADRDPELAKGPLVPLKSLATGLLALRIAHNARGDLPQ